MRKGGGREGKKEEWGVEGTKWACGQNEEWKEGWREGKEGRVEGRNGWKELRMEGGVWKE